jgi:hypothetical protein
VAKYVIVRFACSDGTVLIGNGVWETGQTLEEFVTSLRQLVKDSHGTADSAFFDVAGIDLYDNEPEPLRLAEVARLDLVRAIRATIEELQAIKPNAAGYTLRELHDAIDLLQKRAAQLGRRSSV